MKNEEFIMLRRLKKEDYVEGKSVLWKKRKNDWHRTKDKSSIATDACYRLLSLGYAFKVKEHKCPYCLKYHYYGNLFRITPLGIRFLERNETKKIQKIEVNNNRSFFRKVLNDIQKLF